MAKESKTGPGYGPEEAIKAEKKAKAKGAWSRLKAARTARRKKKLADIVKQKQYKMGEADLSMFRPDDVKKKTKKEDYRTMSLDRFKPDK